MEDSIDPDDCSYMIRVYRVGSGLCVQIFRVNTIIWKFRVLLFVCKLPFCWICSFLMHACNDSSIICFYRQLIKDNE